MNRYAGIQAARPKTRAVVVGGGFIGLEMTENLAHRGFEVTLLEMGDQVLGPLDREMACVVEGYLEHHGVNVVLKDGAVNIPLGQLRARLDELPGDKTIHVFCRSGQRSYYATRLLLQHGFDARNLSGGMLSRVYASFFLQEGPIE